MKDLYKIEFIEGEPKCRVDGVLCTDEYWKDLCGIEGEIYQINDNTILYDDIIYMKEFSMLDILNTLGELHPEVEPYDRAASMGRGEDRARAQEYLSGKIVIGNLKSWKDTKVATMAEFEKNYPEFNSTVYDKLMRSFDEYYSSSNKD